MRFFLIVFLFMILSSGGSSPLEQEKKAEGILQAADQLNDSWGSIRGPLEKAEKKEYVLFNEVNVLPNEMFKKRSIFVSEAIHSAENRVLLIRRERSQADHLWQDIHKLSFINWGENNKTAFNVIRAAKTMHDAYIAFEDKYQQSVREDIALYHVIQDRVPKDVLESHLNRVNNKYIEVFAANEYYNKTVTPYVQSVKELEKNIQVD